VYMIPAGKFLDAKFPLAPAPSNGTELTLAETVIIFYCFISIIIKNF